MKPGEFNSIAKGKPEAVSIKEKFLITPRPIEVEQFRQVLSRGGESTEDESVGKVSWRQANEFCRLLTLELLRSKKIEPHQEVRLPTLAELEFLFHTHKDAATESVGLGEWCLDSAHADGTIGPRTTTDPFSFVGDRRAVVTKAEDGSVNISHQPPDFTNSSVGFRVVLGRKILLKSLELPSWVLEKYSEKSGDKKRKELEASFASLTDREKVMILRQLLSKFDESAKGDESK